MSRKEYDLALIPGDGIGPEVTAAARSVMDRAASARGFALRWRTLPCGAGHYLATGATLTPAMLSELVDCDAALLGAIGDPRVPPGVLEQEILLALRFHFDQYLNLRPTRSFAGAATPVPLPEGERIDLVVVRENTEDFYMGLGARGTGTFDVPFQLRRGLYELGGSATVSLPAGMEGAVSVGLMSRPGIERIARRAFTLALARGEKKVHVVSKANAVPALYGFWDAVTAEVAKKEFPGVQCVPVNVDALAYLMARKPWGWGVLLCPNLFGDIVSDLAAGLAGGLGLAAAGNIGDGLSMFEPVHGSAPDIAGTGRANPLAAILSGAMLFDHLGESGAAEAIRTAVEALLADPSGARPFELGGQASTTAVGAAVANLLEPARAKEAKP